MQPLQLFRTLILRPLRRDLLRTTLTILAVALGVGVVIAIDLAGDAATGSFRSSLETLVGKTDLEIVANGGVDERWIARLAALPVNARFAPVIETQCIIQGAGAATVYGVDFIAQSRNAGGESPRDLDTAAIVSSALAKRIGVHEGDSLSLALSDKTRAFHVASVADAQDAEFVLLDIASAQQALNQFGKLDRIEVFVSPREDFTRVEREIRRVLPASYRIEKPGTRSDENQRMLRAFRWNLRVLSYISLVVGAFLIYNTISVSVVRRRPEIGVLRALGASRRRVFWLFLGEALLFGVAGSLAGIALGRVMAEGAVGLIADTVNSLYVSSRPAAIAIGIPAVATAIIAGTAVAFISALAPAREAMEVTPVEAMSRGVHEHHARTHVRRNLVWAILIGMIAWPVLKVGPLNGNPIAGYVTTLLAIAAMALAAPAVITGLSAMTRRAARVLFGPEGLLAVRGLAASLARTSVIVAALSTAIAMMASVGIMVGSFRETVIVWLDTQLRADLYVRPAGRTGAGEHPALPAEAPALAASVSGVEAVDVFRAMEIEYQDQRAALGAGDSAIVRRYGRLRFLPGEDREAILQSLPGQDRVIVSEPFANKHGVHAGSVLELPLGDRTVPVTVAGIYYDYSSERGWVIFDRSTLLKCLPHQPPTNLAIYVRKDADATEVRHTLEQRLANYRVVVAPNRTLRQNAVTVFDRTFAITYALEGVAIVVAMLGAANSLLAMVLDRRREFGMLRYLGAAPAQIRRMILLEAGFLGVAANALGLALGFVLSLVLIYVINKQSFGWTIQFHPPLALLTGASALVLAATVLAGIFPAHAAARLNPIEVIHEE
ncbi:MAG TPA: FtsX-like permease family protein [Bryobacteraceae bacterium]|nr:FtsX-like permease family protein [Bryobacteraceae bacterium]